MASPSDPLPDAGMPASGRTFTPFALKRRRTGPALPWGSQHGDPAGADVDAGGGASDDCPPVRTLLLLEDTDTKVKRLRCQGVLLAEQGHFRRAAGAFGEAVSFAPADATLHDMKAQVHLEAGDFFEAVQV
jgi:hypothetical protein